MSFWQMLGLGAPAKEAQPETIERITQVLSKLPPEPAKLVACFAAILGRVAYADLEISADEVAAMERILGERVQLAAEQIRLVVQIAKEQTIRVGQTEGYLVTREFAKIATHEQKMELLDCLFAVCAVDENISASEDNEIKKVATQLGLDQREYTAVRSEYRQHLAVLK